MSKLILFHSWCTVLKIFLYLILVEIFFSLIVFYQWFWITCKCKKLHLMWTCPVYNHIIPTYVNMFTVLIELYHLFCLGWAWESSTSDQCLVIYVARGRQVLPTYVPFFWLCPPEIPGHWDRCVIYIYFMRKIIIIKTVLQDYGFTAG